ncbi:MAG: hypothetical protein U9N45_02555 [Gemmatimonadota bacterium]|nr:hypothetical protein [Gemmatimonadota bacterium]
MTDPGTYTGENQRKGAREFSREQREFLDSLIARSGLINRLIMRLYLDIDILGLDRWYAYIQRLRGRKRLANLLSYWPLRFVERVSAFYVGGSLTAAEQKTFGCICRITDYKLTRYNAMVFGSATGFMFFSSGRFTAWLGSLDTIFNTSLDITSFFLYSVGVVSVAVDLFRVIDSYLRKRAHMPFGFFPFAINSTTFFKHLFERSARPGKVNSSQASRKKETS